MITWADAAAIILSLVAVAGLGWQAIVWRAERSAAARKEEAATAAATAAAAVAAAEKDTDRIKLRDEIEQRWLGNIRQQIDDLREENIKIRREHAETLTKLATLEEAYRLERLAHAETKRLLEVEVARRRDLEQRVALLEEEKGLQ